MKITVLGAGGAFSPISRGNSSFLVEQEDRRILIDCGSTVPYVLRDEMGIPLQSVTDVIITHCHADHIGGMEALLYACKYGPGSRGKPLVWADRRVAHGLIQALQPGMGWAHDGSALYVAEEFFDLQTVEGGPIYCHGLPLSLYPVPHIGNMPCFAVGLGKLLVSGDTKRSLFDLDWTPDTVPSLIFHDAELTPLSDSHCQVADIKARPQDLRKTWLYHCPADGVAPEGFAGVLQKKMIFEL